MSKLYKLSRGADLDLLEIEDYTARKWGDAQAKRYIDYIFAALRELGENPNLGRRRPDVPAPYLVYPAESHLIIYRATPAVEVLNILHPSMDIGTRLRDVHQRIH